MARAPLVLEAEEDPAVPARAGDGAGDGRERFVGPALVFEVVVAHRDAVLDALPFADQPRAGDRPVLGRRAALGALSAVELLGQAASSARPSRASAAIGQFLNPVGQPAFQEAAVVGRRLGLEEIAPHGPSRPGVGGLFRAANLGQERICSCACLLRVSAHDRSVGRVIKRTFSAVGR